MSSIESLKEQARRHEQKEEWQKALAQYQKAIDRLAEDDQPDIGLYNRVGDLQTRMGNVEAAVDAYESAVDLYVESELPNNAIAVCKKIIRNMPLRNSVYLKMGQIRAEQGFLVDARQNFLTYAERVQADGDLDEALRALVEFADLAPDDLDIRMAIATQFLQHDQEEQALTQLAVGYRAARDKGLDEQAGNFAGKIREVDPSADPDEMAASAGGGLPAPEEEFAFETTSLDEDEEIGGDFGEITFGEEEPAAAATPAATEPEPDVEPAFAAGSDEPADEEEPEEIAVSGEFGSFEIGGDEDEGEEEVGLDGEADEEAEPLPTFGFDEDEEEAEPLPVFGYDDEEDAEEEAEPLPTFGDEDEDEDAAEPLPTFGYDEGEEEPELDAAAFGESERGEREHQEYVEGSEEMETLEVSGLQELSGADEPGQEDEGAADALAGAAEEAAFEGGLASDEAEAPEEPREPVGDEPVAAATAPDDAHGLLEQGQRLAAEGRTDEARERLGEAMKAFEASGDIDGAIRATRALVTAEPDEVGHRQRMVELAFRKSDESVLATAYMELAETLERAGQSTRAQAVYQQVLSVDPDHAGAREALGRSGPAAAPVREVASSEDYVDLGSMILDEDDDEKSTRFVVAYEEPSGDEQADFAKMLNQFKAKVAENVSADDVKAHHDLGTAYKEMGLVDEAIEEFQQALRAKGDHLPTFELLGQCFIDKGQHDAAVRSLSRALEADFEVEDELLGIYYYLGRAYEAMGNSDSAREFYDRVFSLDINFADVTERLRSLRPAQ